MGIPASQAYRDVSKHGSAVDDEEMREIIRQEKLEEAECMIIRLKEPRYIRGITTRSGRTTGEGAQITHRVHFDPEVVPSSQPKPPISHEQWAGVQRAPKMTPVIKMTL